MTLVGAAAGAAGGRKAMKEKTITVSHEVSPEYGKYCGNPLKIIGTERFCNNVQCFNRFQNV